MGDNNRRSKTLLVQCCALHKVHVIDGKSMRHQISSDKVQMRVIKLHSVLSIHS